MRDHIVTTLRGVLVDLERLQSATTPPDDPDEIISAALDLLDRLSLEVDWLRQQPLSSILDPEARIVLNRYRMLTYVSLLRGEHYLRTMDPADVGPWLESLVDLGQGIQFAEAFPES